MFFITLLKSDAANLPQGVQVKINGEPKLLTSKVVPSAGHCLCWDEQVRPILEFHQVGDTICFTCGDQEGGEYSIISPSMPGIRS